MARLPTILLKPGDLPPYVLLPGDPARAARIAERLEGTKELAKNREFHSYCGSYHGVEIGVISTGVGAPGAAICAEESIKAGARVLIRVGTAGSLQDSVVDGDLVVALGAVRYEGTTPQLLPIQYPALADPDVVGALWNAAQTMDVRVHRGVVVTSDAFYQGVLDLGIEPLSRAGAMAVEMECAALFCVAALRHVRAGAILAIDGDARSAAAGAYNPHRDVVRNAVSQEIDCALAGIVRLHAAEFEKQQRKS